MTSARPEPGWLTDPDDVTGERFWDGAAWTEFRRRYRSVENTACVPRPDQSSIADDHGHHEPVRVPWVANASFTPPAERQSEIPVIGHSARVIAGEHRVGQVGTVVEVEDAGCVLEFAGDRHGFCFFDFSEVEATAPPAVSPVSVQSGDLPRGWVGDGPGVERWWDGEGFVGPARLARAHPRDEAPPARMSDWLSPNRVALVVGLVVIVGVIVVALLPSESPAHDEASYQAGQALSRASHNVFDETCQGASSCQRGGEVITLDSVCRAAVEKGYGPKPKNLVVKDLLAGCVDGFGSR